MSALDHLANTDRIIGYPEDKRAVINTVLAELDMDGVSIKDGFGAAPGPFFANEKAVTMLGTKLVKTPVGTNLLLFYTAGSDNEEKCVFSNYHPAHIIANGRNFLSSEQYFLYMKAKTFKDEERAEKILNAGTPAYAKKLGREVTNFNEEVWKQASIRIMTVACYRKFQQNPALRKTLFSTAGTVLVEASPNDSIWGIGMGMMDARAADPSKWQGTNNLGRILTVIREHMMASKKYQGEF